VTDLRTIEEYRRRADECEQEALDVLHLSEVRQFRLLAQAWRELAETCEATVAREPRSFKDRD
jgi:hypothetical protein